MLMEDEEGKKKTLALPTLAAPTMRFSRRQRGMEINQDLEARQELVMQEAHVAQHRWAPALSPHPSASSTLVISTRGSLAVASSPSLQNICSRAYEGLPEC